MNYKKLWNNLKAEMIEKTETAEIDVVSGFCNAKEILMAMVKAEVAESKIPERQLEIPLAGFLGGSKNGSK